MRAARTKYITLIGGPFCGMTRAVADLYETWKMPAGPAAVPVIDSDGDVLAAPSVPFVLYRLVYSEDGEPVSNEQGEYRYQYDHRA